MSHIFKVEIKPWVYVIRDSTALRAGMNHNVASPKTYMQDLREYCNALLLRSVLQLMMHTTVTRGCCGDLSFDTQAGIN